MFEIMSVDSASLKIKFHNTPKVSTISSDKFSITPVGEVAPEYSVQSIVLNRDYNSLTRELILFLPDSFPTSGQYSLTASGITNVVGGAWPDKTVTFSAVSTPSSMSPTPKPVEVKDSSIKKKSHISSETIVAANPDFYIVRTIPENQAIFVNDDEYDRGRITVVFTARPSTQFLNDTYIRVQRKKVGVLGRWEKIDAHFALESGTSRLHILLPSLDEEPVYDVSGANYFEEGYKYRVRISSELSTIA